MEMYADEPWNKGKTTNNWTQTLTATSSWHTMKNTHIKLVDYKVVVLSNDFSTELT